MSKVRDVVVEIAGMLRIISWLESFVNSYANSKSHPYAWIYNN